MLLDKLVLGTCGHLDDYSAGLLLDNIFQLVLLSPTAKAELSKVFIVESIFFLSGLFLLMDLSQMVGELIKGASSIYS